MGGQVIQQAPIGVGQTWQDVIASRALGTTYYNTTGRPIFVSVGCSGGTNLTQITINGIIVTQQNQSGLAAGLPQVFGVVPNGGSYIVSVTVGGLSVWTELR